MGRNLLEDDFDDGDTDVAVGRIERSIGKRLDALQADIVTMNERIKKMRTLHIRRSHDEFVSPQRFDEWGVPNRVFGHSDLSREFSNALRDLWRSKSHKLLVNAMDPTIEGKGGSLLGEEQRAEMITVLERVGVLYPRCGRIPMSQNAMVIPRATSVPTASYGVVRTEPADSEINTGDIEWRARDLLVYMTVPKTLLDDARIDFGNYAGEQMIRAVAVKRDDVIVNGDGSPSYGGMVGIFNSGDVTVNTMPSGDDTFGEINTDDIIDMESAIVDDPMGDSPIYAAHRSVFGIIRNLKTTTGELIWPQSLVAGQPPELNGYEAVRVPAMPKKTQSAASTKFMAFGDFRTGCRWGELQDMTIERSDDYEFGKRLACFLVTVRHDFHVIPGTVSGENPIVVIKTAAS